MFLSDLSIKRPVLITCVMLALLVLGLFSLRNLGIDQFPKVDIPTITVSVVYPGASPDAVEQDVVRKIEAEPTGPGGPFAKDAPKTPVIIQSIKLEVPGAKAPAKTK